MRVKRGLTKSRRHKSVLKLAKGYRMTYSKSYRRAKQLLLHSGQYEYAHRRRRSSQFRTEWIKVISASLTEHNVSYSKFINLLNKHNVTIDRKNLAELAVHNPESFNSIVKSVTA
ncbi:MAG: 50S ribosomal protein L20 [Candidatus Dojkabacteria bacterium]